MNKKLWILFIALIILLISAGGFFYWWKYVRETPPEEWDLAKTSPPEDYEIKQIGDEKIIENKKVGLSFKIPNDWIVKKPQEGIVGPIKLYEPGAKEKSEISMENGCRVVVNTTFIKTNIETLKREIPQSIWGPLTKSINEMEINKKAGVSYIAESQKLSLYRNEITIPLRNKIYSFTINSSLDEKNRCASLFDNFLENISIK